MSPDCCESDTYVEVILAFYVDLAFASKGCCRESCLYVALDLWAVPSCTRRDVLPTRRDGIIDADDWLFDVGVLDFNC